MERTGAEGIVVDPSELETGGSDDKNAPRAVTPAAGKPATSKAAPASASASKPQTKAAVAAAPSAPDVTTAPPRAIAAKPATSAKSAPRTSAKSATAKADPAVGTMQADDDFDDEEQGADDADTAVLKVVEAKSAEPKAMTKSPASKAVTAAAAPVAAKSAPAKAANKSGGTAKPSANAGAAFGSAAHNGKSGAGHADASAGGEMASGDGTSTAEAGSGASADRGDGVKVPVLKILSIEPPVIRFHQAFKANWAIEIDHDLEVANAELTFQTDDARVVLYEHQGEPEAPVAKPVALWAGARIRKSTLLELRLRTGLVGEESRDGKMAPMSVHARLNGDNQRTLAVSSAFQLQVADLSERQLTKIFL